VTPRFVKLLEDEGEPTVIQLRMYVFLYFSHEQIIEKNNALKKNHRNFYKYSGKYIPSDPSTVPSTMSLMSRVT